MNAVEIEQAITELAEQPFDCDEFPFAFLAAFGNKNTTIRRLRSGSTNKSDLNGILQTGHIHLKVAKPGKVGETLTELRNSAATHNKRHKVRFLLATDGNEFEAEDLTTGETVACRFADFPDHFGFFLPLAGITTVKQIRDSSFDIRATSRLNRLYVTLLHDNPEWSDEAHRHDMNHFMARLIFCFFAEDTNIFDGDDLFTGTIARMSDRDSSNTHEVISEIFRAMNTPKENRSNSNLPRWVREFPYVNGGLFSGSTDVPRFSRIAQRYLLHIGNLDWTQINPDIFGSMIQAVADEEERGALGMHYTSVPNILKVLNPLFLDNLRASLDEAGDNSRKLLNLRKRMSNIRVFDPACGSGNFLVIAYKEMRAIEAEINRRRGEAEQGSYIPLTNFRGIELRDFSAEIARLALIIAEYQCDVLYLGPKEAKEAFLPLDAQNWITCGNALRLDWLSICPPTGTGVKMQSDDLFGTPLDQAEIDFENEGGETYICGNPPYLGTTFQSKEQKAEIRDIVNGRMNSPGFLDYISGWFLKAVDWLQYSEGQAAFVSTNSICQGQMVAYLWPLIFQKDCEICFAHSSFRWSNLASHNAGVTVIIVSIGRRSSRAKFLYESSEEGSVAVRSGNTLSPYLVLAPQTIVEKQRIPLSDVSIMTRGNMPYENGSFLFTEHEFRKLDLPIHIKEKFFKKIFGSADFIQGTPRRCIWINDNIRTEAEKIPFFSERIERTERFRLASSDKGANALANRPHQLKTMLIGQARTIVVPAVSSERRRYLPVGLVDNETALTNLAFALYDAPLWNLAIVASRMHLVWIATVCGKLKTDFRYSNTMGWNTFPVPKLTQKNRADLTECAEEILLTREAHFPATIADLYDPEKMPDDLRAAHDRNDEVLERIYIGRRFKNDTERLEKLFEMYTKMTTRPEFVRH